jgi:hypothetical protein
LRVENDVLYIEEKVGDEVIEKFIQVVSKKKISKIEVKTNDLGASIVQALLIQKRDKEIVIEDPILQKIFENVSYKTV